EAERGLGVTAIVVGQLRDRGQDGLLEVTAQAVEVGAGRLEHRFGRRVVEQGQQQVLDRHVLVARLPGALVALADAVFEILAEHGAGASGELRPLWGLVPGFSMPAARLPFRPFPWCRARGAG